MGTGYIGGATKYRTITENLVNIVALYPLQNGYFGERGQSKSSSIRNLICKDPIKEANKFYKVCAFGGLLDNSRDSNFKIAKMADGTIITFRQISKSDGSPAVSINIKYSNGSCGIKTQKIHFVKGEKG